VEFRLQAWLALPLALKRTTLRRVVQHLRPLRRDVGFEHIENAIEILEHGRSGSKATLPGGLLVTRSYHSFTVAPEHASPAMQPVNEPALRSNQTVPLSLPGVTPLPHSNWQLVAHALPGKQVQPEAVKQVSRWEAYLNADVVSSNTVLRTRRPGDVFQPFGMKGHTKKVNEFMINEKIPARRRDNIPLLVSDNRIVWVCGYRPDERARLGPETNRVLHLKFESQ
jgi:tRNA(Ile)-lysidine synthase